MSTNYNFNQMIVKFCPKIQTISITEGKSYSNLNWKKSFKSLTLNVWQKLNFHFLFLEFCPLLELF